MTLYRDAVGRELRRRREEDQKITRQQLLNRMRDAISIKTLASWETGQREINISRLFELCEALRTTPSAVLAAAEKTIGKSAISESVETFLRIDIRKLAQEGPPPLSKWAKQKVAETGVHHIVIPEAAIVYLEKLADRDLKPYITVVVSTSPTK